MLNSRVSETNEESNDSPPEFTGAKPSEFKSYRKKVKLWLMFTRTPSQIARASCFEQTGPAWDACDGLEPEDVATDDGVNVILETLAGASRVNMKRSNSMLWRALSMDLAGRRVRNSTATHYGYTATHGSWPSKEYVCQTKCRDSFYYVGRT